MPQLLVRSVPEKLVKALKQRASRNGRSAEAEHREILRDALESPQLESFHDFLASMPDVGEDADFERPREFPRRIKL